VDIRQHGLSLVIAALFSCSSLAQFSAARAEIPPETFHVGGTVVDPVGSGIYGVSVAFQNEQTKKVVLTNDAGTYEIDLPEGEYTMTAQGIGFRPFLRPLFRVGTPTILKFDVILHPHKGCEKPILEGDGPTTAEQWVAAQSTDCLHEDFLSPPSQGPPFKLAVSYGVRKIDGTVYSYRGDKTGQYPLPVSVAYNLLSLRANEVSYDVTTHILSASGNIVVRSEPGTILRSDSMAFTIENGDAIPTTRFKTFRVQGTITDSNDAVIPRVEVAFRSKSFDKTVYTDRLGAYVAELPVGDYTMVAEMRQFRPYRRPFFRVTSGRHLHFDIRLDIQPTCDMVVVSSDPEQREADWRRLCFHEEFFAVPTKEEIPFELYVQYGKRSVEGDLYAYTGDQILHYDQVFIAYNMFSLLADRIIYDVKTRTVQATGNVVVTDESGGLRRTNSASFRMEDGNAVLRR